MKSPTRAWPRSSACDGPLEERIASRQFVPQSWTDGSRPKPTSAWRPDGSEFFHSPVGLQGVWLEAFGLKSAAAAAYVDASQDAGEVLRASEVEAAPTGKEPADEEPAAIHLLTRACELDPEHPLAHWCLSDAWRVVSYIPEASKADRATLDKSLAAWNRGIAARRPDAASSWAYTLRAWIAEEFARLDDARRVACWWEAVLYIERAIVLDARDSVRWASLGRCHRLLGNERNSLHATAKALELDPDDASVLEDRGAILADTGAFDEAKAAIDRRIASGAAVTTWVKGVLAYIIAHQARARTRQPRRRATKPHEISLTRSSPPNRRASGISM